MSCSCLIVVLTFHVMFDQVTIAQPILHFNSLHIFFRIWMCRVAGQGIISLKQVILVHKHYYHSFVHFEPFNHKSCTQLYWIILSWNVTNRRLSVYVIHVVWWCWCSEKAITEHKPEKCLIFCSFCGKYCLPI